jgi:uncharacterized alpha-E superfamily protein
MLSRVADSIYWMSRYIERAENVARFIDVNLNLMIDLPPNQCQQWQPLVEVTSDAKWFADKYGRGDRHNVIQFMTFDPEYPNSILSCLRSARENARSVREMISTEMWEQVNKFYLMVKEAAAQGIKSLERSNDFFAEVKMASHLFSGLMNNTLTRNEAWHFCRLGQLLERADKTSRILDVKYFYLLPSPQDVGSTLDDIQWSAVLRSASALEMYRQRFGRIAPARIAEFLVLDREFPRAILYCIIKAEDSLHAISGAAPGTYQNAAEQRVGLLRSELAFASGAQIMKSGLHEFLDAVQTKLNGVGDDIYATYFALQRPEEAALAAR